MTILTHGRVGAKRLIKRPRVTAAIPLSALLLGVLLLCLGSGLQCTLLSLRGGLEGMTDEHIGLTMSMFFVGFVIGAALSPRWIQRVGHIRAFAAFAALTAAIALTYALFIWVPVWIVLRLVQGACHAGMFVVAESWLNAETSRPQRGRVLAIYCLITLVGYSAGPLLLNLARPVSFELFSLVSILLSLALLPVTLTRRIAPSGVAIRGVGFRQLYAISPLGVVGTFAVGMTTNAFSLMGARYGQIIGLGVQDISLFVALFMAGALLLQWPLGWLSDMVDRRLVIIAMSAGAAGVSLTLAWNVAWPRLPLLILSCVLGGLLVPAYSIFVALVNESTELDVVAAASRVIFVYGMGAIAGPVAAGVMMGQVGPSGLFVLIAAVQLVYVGFALYRIPKRTAVAVEVKEPFVALPDTTPVVLSLDKRSDDRVRTGEYAESLGNRPPNV